ncbi:MAG: DNA cytosine methyltransferase [Actinobacteria bacterium]|nr:DNA cytosine methyltransferase [Actinomycetota bacterium]
MRKPGVIDLFAGAGGATQGLRDAGFRVLAAIENDAAAAATYRRNHARTILLDDDIVDVDPRALRLKLGLRVGELTLLKACPPCQGFSSLGACDPNDARNDLVNEVWKFVLEFEPSAILIENVPSLRSDERFIGLLRRMSRAGYINRSYVVDASEVGVPQRRRRLIAVGVKTATNDLLPASILDALPDDFNRSAPTAGEAIAMAGQLIGSTDPIHRARVLKPTTLARIKAVPVGGSRFDLPAKHQLQCHKDLGNRRSASASYGRVLADALAPTMTTRCTTPACGRFTHPTEDRGLSLREASLIQTFPLTYRFDGTYGQVEQQIGNAVPVRLSMALGLVILNLLKSSKSAERARKQTAQLVT